MEGRVTIIGLGCVGTSIGLALLRENPELEVVGHDVDGGNARTAKRLGAVTKTDWNLPSACEGAFLVVLALPLKEVHDTLKILGEHLDEGCVVTDTAALKVPVLEWARQYLPDTVSYVSGFPSPGPMVDAGKELVGPEAAQADLFERGVYFIASASDTNEHATNRLLQLVHVLEAQPLFVEPLEYDGLRSGVGGLPTLLALALARTTMDQPGWMEMRKMAGHEFAAFTAPLSTEQDRFAEVVGNQENLLRRLDMFLRELGEIRNQLAKDNQQALGEAFSSAAERRHRWLNERIEGTWEDIPSVGDPSTAGDHISRIFTGSLFRRRSSLEEEE